MITMKIKHSAAATVIFVFARWFSKICKEFQSLRHTKKEEKLLDAEFLVYECT
jgi:hypothetical protein